MSSARRARYRGQRGTKCGSFTFGFYVFDFDRDPNSKHFLNSEDRKILKAHRIYLYRDKIRVYPYGDPDDDWLRIDAYRGTIAAGWFLSNDQVVGFVNITQKGNPKLRDKTNREGLIEMGDATSDFIRLLQIFLAWVRKKPYGQYLAKQKRSKDVEIVKKEQVKAALDVVAEKLGNNKTGADGPRSSREALRPGAKLPHSARRDDREPRRCRPVRGDCLARHHVRDASRIHRAR